MIHRLAHWLKLNTGKTVSEYDDKGNLWTGFECSGCGQVPNKRFRTPSQLRIDEMLARFMAASLLKHSITGDIQRNAEHTFDVVRFKRPTDYKSKV